MNKVLPEGKMLLLPLPNLGSKIAEGFSKI